jgi:hypothetical protein
MKLFVTGYSYHYEGNNLLAIFSTRELAIGYLTKLGYEQDDTNWKRWHRGQADYGDEAYIQEIQLDKENDG